ncbi:MAG: DUF1343 domain-containing protein [Bacteroidia bacterium]|nr:DUF1343 domain-containing protein [Bacteroidia bacterium]
MIRESIIAILLSFSIASCAQVISHDVTKSSSEKKIITGAEQTEIYLPLLAGKHVAVVANQTSLIGKTHLIDSLHSLHVKVDLVFAPEHGFRGEAEAGETIAASTDSKTGIQIISLYGEKKKPSATDLKGIDVVVFDIQDVGVRFYTYINTMQYVMEACAEQNKTFIVLDRPNPNGFFVDGPLLEEKFKSFVGMNPIPLVHGLTVAEYASMLNGEGWLAGGKKCKLVIVKVKSYSHVDYYALPVPPSPNLPNLSSVYLYPSLGLFEGTPVSVGRGTEFPFQVIGYPELDGGTFSFIPQSIPGRALHPMYEEKKCNGYMLKDFGEMFIRNSKSVYLFWLKALYENYPDKKKFFTSFFDKLAGTDKLKEQIIGGISEEEIRKSWQPALENYKKVRKKYLLYQDFD